MKKQHSFTMIELLTVVAIIAILAGIAVGVANLIADKSAATKTEATIKALELALNMYKDKFGYYPGASLTPQVLFIETTIPDSDKFKVSLWKFLDQKLINTATITGSAGRYFKDGWDHPLIYRCPGKFNKTTFDLGSAGANGKLGDDGPDISSSTDFTSISDTNYIKFGKSDDVVNFVHNSD